MRTLDTGAGGILARLSTGFGWLWAAALLLPAVAVLVDVPETARNVHPEARNRATTLPAPAPWPRIAARSIRRSPTWW